MSDDFVCGVCGEKHTGLVKDWAYQLPDIVWDIPESERADKARFDSDRCQYGEIFFIRCVLDVPLLEEAGAFGWGAWAQVELSVFKRYLHFYDKDGSAEPRLTGLLANKLPPYTPSLGVPVEIQFRSSTARPSLYVHEKCICSLALEQKVGISNARYHEILELLMHR